MKKLDSNEYAICRKQGKLFQESLKKTELSSPVFIRRFMNSNIALAFDDRSILVSAIDDNSIFESIEEEYGKSSYGKTKYSEDELYWIGYIYRVMCFYYDKSSKYIYKLFPASEIVKYYFIGHTYDPEHAVQDFMAEKGYIEDNTLRGVEILKRLENIKQ